jgi:hypothetical protein
VDDVERHLNLSFSGIQVLTQGTSTELTREV